VAETHDSVLEDLLGWWVQQGCDPADARGIAEWLWLQDSMKDCALPRRFVVGPGRSFSVEADPVLDAESHQELDAWRSGRSPAVEASDLPPPTLQALPDPHAPAVFPDPPPVGGEAAKPTARLFSEAQLPDDDDVRARLQRRKGFVPLLLRQEPMLQRPLTLLGALRPLLQKQPHAHWRVLDEEYTAELSADLGRPWPVLRPRLAAAVDVHLWLDAGVAMAVWQPLAQELQRVLASSQGFARVELRQFHLDLLHGMTARSGTSQRNPQATVLTLVLSDTAGRHWWDGSMTRWLAGIARHQPLAVLHTLPSRYRVRTALRQGVPVTLSNGKGLGPNSGYLAVPVASLDPRQARRVAHSPLPAGLKLPVLSLNPSDLAPWGALVMGDALARTGGAVLPVADPTNEPPPIGPGPEPPPPLSAAEAEALWLAFRQQASPEAQRLMRLMAAAPLLTLPVLRLLLAAELPEVSDPLPLAEVLVSGLVRRCEGPAAASAEAVQFELLPAVQELLEPQLEPRARVAVIQAITDLLERRLAQSGSGTTFETLLSDPTVAQRHDAAGLAHFANVTAAMLDRLPGQPFRDIARQLRAGSGGGPTPLWPAAMVFETHIFDTAWQVDTPELESLVATAARWHDVQLQKVEFPALLPADLITFLHQVEKEGGAAARASLPNANNWAFHEPLRREGLQPGDTSEAGDLLALTLVELPAGTFLLGSPPQEPQRQQDEGPQHEVTLASFFMSQTPITQAQWREVALWQEQPGEQWGRKLKLKLDPSRFQSKDEQEKNTASLLEGESDTNQRPVETVSWWEAMEFCHRLSQRTGRTYTLPSEAQWEYACRAGTKTPFCFGDTISPELANYDGNYGYAEGPKGIYRKQPTPVGMFPANAWGLQDMHGNVYEWCLDEWHENYDGAPADGGAWVDGKQGEKRKETEKIRLLRGGSWYVGPWYCRSACRTPARPGNAGYGVGFRVVCLPQGPSLNS
jgi:formylglycine-generating enzyme required for sulfatase activity